MSTSDQGSGLRRVVAALAVVQGVLGLLRALQLVNVGTDVAEHGVLLLPLIGALLVIRGILVATIAILYAVFAWGAFSGKTWARPIGIIAAAVNGSLVLAVLIGGGGSLGALLWIIVPLVILVYLLTPAGRQAFSRP